MYKKFLAPVLILVAALTGCNHPSTDEQTPDQTDAAMPTVQDQQDQMGTPGNSDVSDQMPATNGQIETQPSTSATDSSPVTPANEPATTDNSATKTPSVDKGSAMDKKSSSTHKASKSCL